MLQHTGEADVILLAQHVAHGGRGFDGKSQTVDHSGGKTDMSHVNAKVAEPQSHHRFDRNRDHFGVRRRSGRADELRGRPG